VYFFP
jgi:hypothetical protein